MKLWWPTLQQMPSKSKNRNKIQENDYTEKKTLVVLKKTHFTVLSFCSLIIVKKHSKSLARKGKAVSGKQHDLTLLRLGGGGDGV